MTIAIDTVTSLIETVNVSQVTFCCFSAADFARYEKRLNSRFPENPAPM